MTLLEKSATTRRARVGDTTTATRRRLRPGVLAGIGFIAPLIAYMVLFYATPCTRTSR